jgi:hypothetical protein
MKQVIVSVPEKKIKFFLELMNSLGFNSADDVEVEVPEEHKKLIRNRIKTAGAKSYSDWDKARTRIKLD